MILVNHLGDDHRTIADLLIEQIEFADILLITKCDLVTKQPLKGLQRY